MGIAQLLLWIGGALLGTCAKTRGRLWLPPGRGPQILEGIGEESQLAAVVVADAQSHNQPIHRQGAIDVIEISVVGTFGWGSEGRTHILE